jgi:hypothetical protein
MGVGVGRGVPTFGARKVPGRRRTRSVRIHLPANPVPTPSSQSSRSPLDLLEGRARSLSDALAAALAAVVREPTAVRACGRALGVDKNLAWRLVRLSEAADLAGVLASRPGSRGWALAESALARLGCRPELMATLSEARAAFEREILEQHVEKGTLRLLAYGGLETAAGREQILGLRREAAAAAARRFGTWADAMVSSYLVTPTGEDDLLDIRCVTLLSGLRRVAAGPNLEIHRGTNSGSDARAERYRTSIASHRGIGSLVPALSSPDALEQLVVTANPARSIVHFRGEGIAATQGIDLTFVESIPRAAYTYARHEGENGAYGAPALVPTACFILEVLVDRSVTWGGTADAAMFTQIAGPVSRVQYFEQQRLPMVEAPEREGSVDLPRRLGRLGRHHRAAIEHAASECSRTVADFTIHRVVVSHPPLSTNIALRWRLPRRTMSEDR